MSDALTIPHRTVHKANDPTVVPPVIVRQDSVKPSISVPFAFTDAILTQIVGKGTMTFSINYNDLATVSITGSEGADVVTPVEGVSGFDHILALMAQYPRAKVSVDVGVMQQSMQPVTPVDVQKLKDAFIAIYGNVDRPDYYK